MSQSTNLSVPVLLSTIPTTPPNLCSVDDKVSPLQDASPTTSLPPPPFALPQLPTPARTRRICNVSSREHALTPWRAHGITLVALSPYFKSNLIVSLSVNGYFSFSHPHRILVTQNMISLLIIGCLYSILFVTTRPFFTTSSPNLPNIIFRY